MDNDDAKRTLLEIRSVVARIYPFGDDDTVDARYAMAFGLIAGIATEALMAVRSNRPMKINLKEPPHA